MFKKIVQISKDRGVMINVTSDKVLVHVSIIPKSMDSTLIPISFSCSESELEKCFNEAIDNMYDKLPQLIQLEAYNKSLIQDKKTSKKKEVEENDTPDMFEQTDKPSKKPKTESVKEVEQETITDKQEMIKTKPVTEDEAFKNDKPKDEDEKPVEIKDLF